MSITGRVAVVTGAGNGLGRAHALYLASQGASIVVFDLSEEAVRQVVDDIGSAGGTALAAVGSVTDEVAVKGMVDAAMMRFGKIDILINNAGILRDKTFAKGTIDDFRLILEVHLMGSVICTRSVWDVMRQQNFGRIVFTTSSSGLFGNFGQANYGAAKMALVGLMQTLALEGAKYNIRVNCLAPTAATQMTADLFTPEVLAALRPEYVSPGLYPLVLEDAPTRAIVCAGAGHFSTAQIALTKGMFIGTGSDAGQRVAQHWPDISNVSELTIPDQGSRQGELELMSANHAKGAGQSQI